MKEDHKKTRQSLLAYRYWKQHGHNPFEGGDDSWYKTEDGTISSKKHEQNMEEIATKYHTTSDSIYVIIDIAFDRDLDRTMGTMGGRTPGRTRQEKAGA